MADDLSIGSYPDEFVTAQKRIFTCTGISSIVILTYGIKDTLSPSFKLYDNEKICIPSYDIFVRTLSSGAGKEYVLPFHV
jgi:hypothetical protein